MLSHLPMRPLTSEWEPDAWKSSRVQAVAVYANPVWIKIGVCYGFACDPQSTNTIQSTDRLLSQLTQRIVHDARGPRAIVGDFNNAKLPFEQIRAWKRAGFVDLQTCAKEAWGRAIEPTSRHRTTIDHIWVSSELLPFLRSVEVESTLFPDHALVMGHFDGFEGVQSISIWPKPLPWEEVSPDSMEDAQVPPPLQGTVDERYRRIMHLTEQSVDDALRGQGKPGLLPQQRGRATTTAPVQKQHPVIPLRRSRKSETQVTFMGEQFQHVQWCRQVRRLQSLANMHRSHAKATLGQKEALWKSIKQAPGFPGGFAKAWLQRTVVLPNSPPCLPRRVPNAEVVQSILATMIRQFEQLEHELNQVRWQSAKQKRKDNPNMVYQDVARQKSMLVQTQVHSTVVEVTNISDDHLTLEYHPHALALDQPVFAEGGLLSIASHEPGRIQLHQKEHVDVQTTLRQERETPCFLLKGWCVEPPSFSALRQALCTQPDMTDQFVCEAVPCDEILHLFTDGSTQDPAVQPIRISTWALVCADLHRDTFVPCSIGGVPGFVQTTLRAELTAIISAFRFGIRTGRCFYVWTDSQVGYDGILRFRVDTTINVNQADHDLWTILLELWRAASEAKLFERVVKVRSHQDETAYSDVVEKWAIRGNDEADKWAVIARQHLPVALRKIHHQAKLDYHQYSRCRDQVHDTLCAVGTQSVESKPARDVCNDLDWEEVDRARDVTELPSFSGLPSMLPENCGGALGDNAKRIFDWLQTLTSAEGAQPRWISAYELLLHYQASTGHVGVWYNSVSRLFEDAQGVFLHKGFDFLKLSGWFQSALKELAKQLGTHFAPQSRLPHSSIFKCWTRCLLIHMCPHQHAQVGAQLRPAQNGRVTAARQAFGSLPACASLRF
eukprot:Skav227301  [mRNA]  locus=scaffold2645:246411:250984:- [translate_table: standard]